MTDAVILVGGKGSRLGKLTKNTPKPLLKIKNKTFIDILLSKLIKYKFKRIFLLCSFKKEKFFKLYNNKTYHESKIICINEGEPKDTAGALYKLKFKIKNNFFLLNGDTFFDINLNLLTLSHKNIVCNMALTKNNYNANKKMNNLSINNKGLIKYSTKKTNLMNGGIYLLNKKIFKFITNKKISLENEIFPKLIDKKKLQGTFFNEKFIDIGNKKNLSYLRNNEHYLKQKALFLDRDGVINKLKKDGYIENFNQFKFLKGVHEGIRYLNSKNFLVIIITNQSCVGRSIITEKQLNYIHFQMKKSLKNKDSFIDDIFYSPYYEYSKLKKYRLNKGDRKPNTGMLVKAINKWNINVKKSFFIGDQMTDYLAANKIDLTFCYRNKFSLFTQLRKICK